MSSRQLLILVGTQLLVPGPDLVPSSSFPPGPCLLCAYVQDWILLNELSILVKRSIDNLQVPGLHYEDACNELKADLRSTAMNQNILITHYPPAHCPQCKIFFWSRLHGIVNILNTRICTAVAILVKLNIPLF